jgi:hypothetical protein
VTIASERRASACHLAPGTAVMTARYPAIRDGIESSWCAVFTIFVLYIIPYKCQNRPLGLNALGAILFHRARCEDGPMAKASSAHLRRWNRRAARRRRPR